MQAKIETRYIVISPSSAITSDQVTRFIHNLAAPVQIKETCFGAIVEGEPEVVHKVMEQVRKLDPNRIFTKKRGYPIGDARRCRAEHGSRPGFTQLEKEWKDLPMFEAGLASCDRGEKVCEVERPKKMKASDLKKVCDEVCKL